MIQFGNDERATQLLAASTWDVIVIGAGVTGATAALSLMRADPARRVLLVDRSDWPRDKVCGSCLNAAGVAGLKTLGVLGRIQPVSRPVSSVMLRVGRRQIDVKHTGGIAIDRRALDSALVDAAVEAGASFLHSAAARVVHRTSGRWAVDLSHQGQVYRTSANAVLAADGLSSNSLAQLPGFGWTISESSYMGIGATIPWTFGAVRNLTKHNKTPSVIRMHLGRGGYVGLVELASGMTGLAAAFNPAMVKDVGGPHRAVALILESCGVPPIDLAHVQYKGTPLLTRQREQVAAPGLLAIGDSAGYHEPFTGEGMTWGIASAMMASKLLDPVLRHSASEQHAHAAADHWSAWHRGRLSSRTRLCRILSKAIRRPSALEMGVAALSACPGGERLCGAIGNIMTTLDRGLLLGHCDEELAHV